MWYTSSMMVKQALDKMCKNCGEEKDCKQCIYCFRCMMIKITSGKLPVVQRKAEATNDS